MASDSSRSSERCFVGLIYDKRLGNHFNPKMKKCMGILFQKNTIRRTQIVSLKSGTSVILGELLKGCSAHSQSSYCSSLSKLSTKCMLGQFSREAVKVRIQSAVWG